MSENVKAIATSAKTGGQCTATINGIDTVIEVARDLTVASGDSLFVAKYSGRAQWVAVARLGTAAPAASTDTADPVPPTRPTVTTGKLVVGPVETRSRQGSRWRSDNDDVYQGQYGGNGNHIGCVFYGTKPRSLDGSTVTRATIKVKRKNAGGIIAPQSTTMRLMTERRKPSGAPTLTSSTSGPRLKRGSSDGSFDIPVSWAQAIVDGSAGGIAFYDSSGSPYVIFAGRGDYSAAFTLTIYWKRG